MPIYTLTETYIYEVEANSEDEAFEKFENVRSNNLNEEDNGITFLENANDIEGVRE
jgi:hypothetical protein